MSLDELKEAAKPLFDKYQVNKLYATSDGQFFLLDSRARLHAGKNHTVYTIEAEETQPAPETTPGTSPENAPVKEALSVKAITDAIAEEKDLSKLNNMLLAEISGANRKTAVQAIEKRIALLTDLRKENTQNG